MSNKFHFNLFILQGILFFNLKLYIVVLFDYFVLSIVVLYFVYLAFGIFSWYRGRLKSGFKSPEFWGFFERFNSKPTNFFC